MGRPLLLLVVLLVGLALALWREREREWELRDASVRQALARTERQAAALTQRWLTEREHSGRLQGRLVDVETRFVATANRRDTVEDVVRQFVQDREQERRQRHEALQASIRPMAEGLRLALVTLNQCLAAASSFTDGSTNLRCSRAARLQDHVLFEPVLLAWNTQSLTSTHYLPDSVRFELDRSGNRIAMRMFGGKRIARGQATPIPASGETLIIGDVDGETWEARLPYLVQATGEYPARTMRPEPSAVMDPVTRASWLTRLDRLLLAGKGTIRYRVERLANLRGGEFTEVLLTGGDDKKRLTMSVEARSMQVLVDRTTRTVSLVFRGGILRRVSGETKIGDAGYHVLLMGVEPQQAEELLLGQVVIAGVLPVPRSG